MINIFIILISIFISLINTSQIDYIIYADDKMTGVLINSTAFEIEVQKLTYNFGTLNANEGDYLKFTTSNVNKIGGIHGNITYDRNIFIVNMNTYDFWSRDPPGTFIKCLTCTNKVLGNDDQGYFTYIFNLPFILPVTISDTKIPTTKEIKRLVNTSNDSLGKLFVS